MRKILVCAACLMLAAHQAMADDAALEAARQRIGSNLLIPYGVMLCGTALDAIRLRAMDRHGMDVSLPSCHATFGGWGALTDYNSAYGIPLVQLSIAESGWVSGTFYTCQMYAYIQPRIPGAAPVPTFCGSQK